MAIKFKYRRGMKYVKCETCKRDAWVDANCVMAICPVCMEEMKTLEEWEELDKESKKGVENGKRK